MRLTILVMGLILIGGVYTSSLTAAETDPAPVVKKTIGFSGDPARKRGLEIGFDQGVKAGKQDKDAGKKPDPKLHDTYNNPDKFYRYEYGSRAAFNSSYRSGFLGGYQQALGKKVSLTPSSTATGSTNKATTMPPRTKSVDPASDAL